MKFIGRKDVKGDSAAGWRLRLRLRYPDRMFSNDGEFFTTDQAGALVRTALGVEPRRMIRQTLTFSGNAVFRAVLPDNNSVVLRVSPQSATFKYTERNLAALRELGLPVQTVLASGPAISGGSFIILNWIPGRDLMNELPQMSREQLTRIAEAIADCQRRVATLPAGEKFGWAPIGKNPASARWTDIFGPAGATPIPADASPLQRLLGRLRIVRMAVESCLARVRPICFLDDLTIKNVLVENGELTGIIDLDFVCFGDPLMAVGNTLALIAADVGEAGRFYGQELVRCTNPSADGDRAIRFYSALWIVGMVKTAETAGDLARAEQLIPIADEMLRAAESAFDAASFSAPADQLLELATARHRGGNMVEARRLYQQALAERPGHTVAQFRLGLLELQEGKLEAALPLVEQAVAAAPDEPRYQFGLGEVLNALKRWDEAAAAYRRAVDLDPRSADAWFALGGAMRARGSYADAIGAFETAVQIQPDYADAYNDLGNCRKLLGDLPNAESAYRQALAVRPNHASAMSNLGTVLQAQGQTDKAIELLRSAVSLDPLSVTYAINLGAVLCQRGRFIEAEPLLRGAVTREKDNPKAAFNLGNALHGTGQLREAAEQYRNAIALRPNYADALNNLANVYRTLGEFKLAAATYELAMRARPDFIPAINNAGMLLRTMGRLEQAEAVLRRGLASAENHPTLLTNLGNVLKDTGRLDDAIDCFRRSLELDPTDSASHSNLAYSLSFQAEEATPILQECVRWNDRHAVQLGSQIAIHSNDRTPGRRLRIGYVSPDFRDHCQSLFTIPLLSHHDHVGFEIFCYSSVERPDDHTRRISGYADVWRDVRLLDDTALCDLIRKDQIDILVDLTMHMAHGRPLVFARKPAPVQIAWLAYPGTTGISTVDYRFSDPRLDPPDFDSHYTERTIRLPDSFWCYDPLVDQPEVNDLPALLRGQPTFGCLNNPCKWTDHTLRLWGGVMRPLPGARLTLLAPPGSPRQHLLNRLAAHDIPADRVNFVSFRPRREYLRAYHEIDLGLDTFPYNGHTTSLDSFWMGVPVVTRIGRTCVGRGGLSQLSQLNLLELAADTDEAFVSAAVSLANDLPRLSDLRKQLRARLSQSPLMDAKRFARNFESAYRRMWDDYCTGSSHRPIIQP